MMSWGPLTWQRRALGEAVETGVRLPELRRRPRRSVSVVTPNRGSKGVVITEKCQVFRAPGADASAVASGPTQPKVQGDNAALCGGSLLRGLVCGRRQVHAGMRAGPPPRPPGSRRRPRTLPPSQTIGVTSGRWFPSS